MVWLVLVKYETVRYDVVENLAVYYKLFAMGTTPLSVRTFSFAILPYFQETFTPSAVVKLHKS